MHVLVMSAGVVGVAAAWQLLENGHEVTVIERRDEAFPSAGDYARPRYRACLRPMTPEGTPVLGQGRYRNLWHNSGHGHLGWTIPCGTARISADLIAGRTPDPPLEGLTLR